MDSPESSRLFQSSQMARKTVGELRPPIECKHMKARVTVTRLETKFYGLLTVYLTTGDYFWIPVISRFHGNGTSDAVCFVPVLGVSRGSPFLRDYALGLTHLSAPTSLKLRRLLPFEAKY